MTTWREAFSAFRAERKEAEKLKERRDQLVRRLDLTKRCPMVRTWGGTNKTTRDLK